MVWSKSRPLQRPRKLHLCPDLRRRDHHGGRAVGNPAAGDGRRHLRCRVPWGWRGRSGVGSSPPPNSGCETTVKLDSRTVWWDILSFWFSIRMIEEPWPCCRWPLYWRTCQLSSVGLPADDVPARWRKAGWWRAAWHGCNRSRLSGAPSQPLYRLMPAAPLDAAGHGAHQLESVKLMSAQGFINWIYSLQPKEPRGV